MIKLLEHIVGNSLVNITFTGVFIFSFAFQSFSQNLVPNPSFEEFDTLICSFVSNKIDFNTSMKYWKMPTNGTPDIYFNTSAKECISNPHSMANIAPGNQEPRDGNNMVGIITLIPNNGACPNYREYIQIELLEPLEVSKKYLAGFYISLADNMQFASNNIGMLFTDNLVGSDTCNRLPYKPQINFTEIIEEKKNWIFLNKYFVSSEPSKYLTLGNFYSDDETQTKKVSDSIKIFSHISYYFIDSVFVEPINELIIPNVFTPNDDKYNQHFVIDDLQPNKWILFIVNRWGQQVYQSKYYHNEWDGQGLPSGVYYYYLKHRYVDIEYKGTVTILR